MIVLPPEASIGAFAMGIIGWYGMVRNGVQLIYTDLKAAKSFDRDIEGLREGLLKQQRKIEKWKMQWLVSEDAPESLFLDFWGDAEYRGIKTTLSDMAANCNTTEKELKSFVQLDEKKWNAMTKCRKRILFIAVKGEYIRKLMDHIEKSVDGLQEAAKNGWQRSDFLKKPNVDFAKVYHAGIGRLLVPIAMRIRDDADALHHSCRLAREDTTLALDLDIFNHTDPDIATHSGALTSSTVVSREASAATIAKAAKNDLFVWKLLVQNSQTTNMGSVRMQVQKVKVRNIRAVGITVAVDRIMRGNADKSHFEISGICFSIAMAQNSNHSSPEPHRTLRDLFSGNDPPSFTNEDMLGKISKFRVVFELAQACLLLLRTSWFPRICSCHLRCARCFSASAELTYDIGLQMGSVSHETPRWATEVTGHCWGIDNYNWNSLTRPLRHFGLLLIEIVIGTPIRHIHSDTSGVIGSIDWAERSDSLENVLTRVRRAFSGREAAEDAVRYCLTKVYPEAPMDDDMKDLLAEYYLDVVAP